MATTTRMGLEQIQFKAKQQLDESTRAHDHAQSRLDAAQENVARLDEQASKREQHLEDLRLHAKQLAVACVEAQNYAAMAQGTAGEREALATVIRLEKTSAEIQKELAKAEHQAETARTKETTVRADLGQQIAQYSRELDEVRQNILRVQTIHQRSVRELGEQLYRQAITDLEIHQRRIASKRQEVVQAQLDESRCFDDALQQLEDWPDYQRAIKARVSVEDAATRTLEVFIAALDTLLREGGQAEIDPTILGQVCGARSVAEMLTLTSNEIWPSIFGGDPRLGHERREQLHKVLTLYRETKGSK